MEEKMVNILLFMAVTGGLWYFLNTGMDLVVAGVKWAKLKIKMAKFDRDMKKAVVKTLIVSKIEILGLKYGDEKWINQILAKFMKRYNISAGTRILKLETVGKYHMVKGYFGK